MMYPEIAVPSEGDGSTFALIGHGYYRGHRLAEIHHRVAAGLIDLTVFVVPWLLCDALRHLLTQNSAPGYGAALLVLLPALAAAYFNVVFMQARTGQSLGKLCLGLVLVRPMVDPMNVAASFFTLPSAPLLVVRWGFHVLDSVLLVGLWFVALTQRRESIADKACNTMVLKPHDHDHIALTTNMFGARDR